MKELVYESPIYTPETEIPKKSVALNDFIQVIKNSHIWWNMAKIAIKNRFRRTLIGPLWITISLAIWIGMLTIVNSYLFNSSPWDNIPRLIVGMVFWTFMTTVLNDGTMALIAYEGLIKNLPISILMYINSVISQNVITLFFNMLLYPMALIFLFNQINFSTLLIIPGIIIFLINIVWVTTCLAILSTRFRDLPRIINSLTQVAFFVTPVFWLPNRPRLPMFIKCNPFYHMMEIVRAPLIGTTPNNFSWLITISAAILGSIFTVWLYEKTFRKIRLWL